MRVWLRRLACTLGLAFASFGGATAQAQTHPGEAVARRSLAAPTLKLEGQFILGGEDDSSIFYILWPTDTRAGLTLVTTLEMLAEDEKVDEGLGTKRVEIFVADCKAKTDRAVGASLYDVKDNRLETALGEARWSPINPNTVDGYNLGLACAYRPKAKELYDSRDDVEEDALETFLLSSFEDALGAEGSQKAAPKPAGK